MRAWLLCGLAAAACTRLNPAYADEVESSGGQASSGDATGSEPLTETGASDGQTSGARPDVGAARRCVALPMAMNVPSVDAPQVEFSDVPILVDLSHFERAIDAETLRFYVAEALVPHELEKGSAIAWVRIPLLRATERADLRAVMGPDCDVPSAAPSRDVWSNGYVAVFHFDHLDRDAFVDSVERIRLLPDTGSEPSTTPWRLGGHVVKSGDGSLSAVDSDLDLSGPEPLATLAWVRLREEQSSLPWDPELAAARHREVVQKLPGYRLTAVAGAAWVDADTPPAPFFNIAEVLTPAGQSQVRASAPVPEETWTMLAGTYDGSAIRLFVDDEMTGPIVSGVAPGEDPNQDIRVGRWLRGDIDEVRISDVVRTPGWIRLQYVSMTDALIEYGAPEPY